MTRSTDFQTSVFSGALMVSFNSSTARVCVALAPASTDASLPPPFPPALPLPFAAPPAGAPVAGIGFALSSADMLRVLRRFYPAAAVERLSAPPQAEPGVGTVRISSEPDGAEITVDGKFVGTTPSMLRLAAGPHEIALKAAGRLSWRRTLDVMKDSDVSVKAALEPEK